MGQIGSRVVGPKMRIRVGGLNNRSRAGGMVSLVGGMLSLVGGLKSTVGGLKKRSRVGV